MESNTKIGLVYGSALGILVLFLYMGHLKEEPITQSPPAIIITTKTPKTIIDRSAVPLTTTTVAPTTTMMPTTVAPTTTIAAPPTTKTPRQPRTTAPPTTIAPWDPKTEGGKELRGGDRCGTVYKQRFIHCWSPAHLWRLIDREIARMEADPEYHGVLSTYEQ